MSLAHALGLHVDRRGRRDPAAGRGAAGPRLHRGPGLPLLPRRPGGRIPALVAAHATGRPRGHTGRRADPRFIEEFHQQLGLPEAGA